MKRQYCVACQVEYDNGTLKHRNKAKHIVMINNEIIKLCERHKLIYDSDEFINSNFNDIDNVQPEE